MAGPRCSPVALMLLITCCCAASAAAADQELTHLHFYFHEVNAGAPNATVVNVASLHKNASTFGDLNVFDNPLREGPDPASRLIGRAQGIGLHASLDESGGLTAIDFVFSDHGEYSGSTLATLGPKSPRSRDDGVEERERGTWRAGAWLDRCFAFLMSRLLPRDEFRRRSRLGHFTVSGPSERSIVGGTGKLRFARGYMISKFLSSTDTAIVVVFDMYFTLAH